MISTVRIVMTLVILTEKSPEQWHTCPPEAISPEERSHDWRTDGRDERQCTESNRAHLFRHIKAVKGTKDLLSRSR